MKTGKRLLSLALMLIMCFTIIPIMDLGIEASAAYENTHTNTGNQRVDIVEVAKTQLGYTEGSGNNNKYGAAFGNNYAPWCAYFVSWCAKEAGISDSIIHRQGIASPFSGYFNIPNSHGNKSYFPKPGDIVFYGPNSNGDHYHVGIVETVNSSTGYITTIEGNTNNNGSSEGYIVYRHTRHYKASNICCYGYPNYINNVEKKGKIKVWLSDSEYGDIPSSFAVGNRYYLCYKMIDGISGKDWNDVSNDSYKVKLTVYKPDGSVFHSNEPVKQDDSWISMFYKIPGTYKYEVIMTGDLTYKKSGTFVVNDNPKKIYASVSSVALKLGELEEKTISVRTGGYYEDPCILNFKTSNENVTCEWGTKTDGVAPLKIKAKNKGTTTVTLSVKDKATGKTLHSVSVAVTVDAKTYAVSYNANGGTGAPANQTKYHNTSLKLSNTVPTRFGYRFLGWSTSSTATTANYQPGATYSSNSNTTLYAVWELKMMAISNKSTTNAVISNGGEMKYFTFIPSSSGTYVIYSKGSDDTKVYLYNESGAELASNDDGTDGKNFRLEYNLKAGTKYIFGVKYYNSSKTGTIVFNLGNVYTITYNANGGSNIPLSQKKDYGVDIKLSSIVPTKIGYTFKGWSLHGITSAILQPGAVIDVNANISLYAEWAKNPVGVQSVSIKTNPTKTNYTVGEALDTTGLALTVRYSDGSSETVTSGFTCSPNTLSKSGIQKITVNYNGYTTSFNVNVKNIPAVNKNLSVSIDDLTIIYHTTKTLNPKIEIDENVKYTVIYKSGDESVVKVDATGKVTTMYRGSTTITCTVTDEFGNTASDTCSVEVELEWWEWIVWIFLWGWAWY